MGWRSPRSSLAKSLRPRCATVADGTCQADISSVIIERVHSAATPKTLLPGPRYPETHPWIDFSANLTRLGIESWMLLGEIRSKVAHIAGTPLNPAVARELHRVYLAKGAHATTAIGGNTLTESEVRDIIEARLRLPPSREYQAREVKNILEALGVVDGLVSGSDRPVPVTADLLLRLNGLVLADLELDPDVVPGQFRRHSVVVGNANRAPDASEVPELVDRLCTWLDGDGFDPGGEVDWRVPEAVIQAALAHSYIAWIHPFGDGNGRTARLIEFLLLLDGGFPTPAAHLLTNHYNLTRSDYARRLALASRERDVLPFLRYAIRGLVDGLQEQLTVVREQQYEDRWEQFVYQQFAGASSPSDVRRRRVALALARQPEPMVPVSAVRRLTPDLVDGYAGKTAKTVTRDLNALVAMDLVERVPGNRVRAQPEIVLAFLPPRVDR